MELISTILKAIRSIRKRKKITTSLMADVLGISQSTYSRIELGQQEITLDYFLKICEYLKINPASFFQNSENYNIEVSKNEYSEIKKTLGLLSEKFK